VVRLQEPWGVEMCSLQLVLKNLPTSSLGGRSLSESGGQMDYFAIPCSWSSLDLSNFDTKFS
jgi:hypothetical protein